MQLQIHFNIASPEWTSSEFMEILLAVRLILWMVRRLDEFSLGQTHPHNNQNNPVKAARF